LAACLTLAACSENEMLEASIHKAEPIVISFSVPTPTRQIDGYIRESRIGNRVYFFRSDNEDIYRSFISHVERLIPAVENIITFPPTGQLVNIYHFNHEDMHTIGWLTSFLSSQRLPIWLCAGIEVLARGLYIPMHDGIIENFGDFHFAPFWSLWDIEQLEKAVATAYRFVNFLIENEALDELVELFMERNLSTAYEKAEAHFYSFAGKPMVTGIALELGAPSTEQGFIMRKSTQWGDYTFVFSSFRQRMSIYDMQRYIAYIDKATYVVVDWLSDFFEGFNDDFVPINHRIYYGLVSIGTTPNCGYADWTRNQIVYAGLSHRFPYIALHEIVHILDFRLGGMSFEPFTEGLAHLLDDYFAEFGGIGFGNYHRRAYTMLAAGGYGHMNDLGGPGANFNERNPRFIPELTMRITATSFVQYLIETYGGEKYFQVHWSRNFRDFENVYGATIHELILRWREFLEEYVASH
jgi:hypothetical protein